MSYSATISVLALLASRLPSIFTSVKLLLGYDLDCDLVLGMNWIGLCRVVILDGSVDFLPSSPECCALSG